MPRWMPASDRDRRAQEPGKKGGTGYVAVWRIQLEEGNLPTAWGPAPEDIVAEAVSQISG